MPISSLPPRASSRVLPALKTERGSRSEEVYERGARSRPSRPSLPLPSVAGSASGITGCLRRAMRCLLRFHRHGPNTNIRILLEFCTSGSTSGDKKPRRTSLRGRRRQPHRHRRQQPGGHRRLIRHPQPPAPANLVVGTGQDGCRATPAVPTPQSAGANSTTRAPSPGLPPLV